MQKKWRQAQKCHVSRLQLSTFPWLILSRVLVTYTTGFRLDDCIDCILHTVLGTTGNYSTMAILHTLLLTATQALQFSAFTSRILTTDLSQSHCNFKSHMKSSWHSLIHFLPLLQFPIRKTRLDYSRLPFYTPSCLLTVPFYNQSARTSRKTPFPIVNKGRLQLRCLATNVLLLRALVLPECVCRPVTWQGVTIYRPC
jgi:hypothetical protein